MLKEMFGYLCVIIFCITGSKTCNIHVCFKWKVSTDILTLACKVGELKHQVFISNQYDIMQADCSPPFPQVSCKSYYNNGSIQQNKKTNDTIFKMTGDIDNRINGNWTCRHGSRLDVATVEVTVFNEKKNLSDSHVTKNGTKVNQQKKMEGNECMTVVICATFVSYVVGLLLIWSFMSIKNFSIQIADDCVKKYITGSDKRRAVFKTVVMLVCTALSFVAVVLFELLLNGEENDCVPGAVLGGIIGFAIGCVFSLLCHNKRADAQDPVTGSCGTALSTNPNAEAQQNDDPDTGSSRTAPSTYHQAEAQENDDPDTGSSRTAPSSYHQVIFHASAAEPHENHDEDREPSAADSLLDPSAEAQENNDPDTGISRTASSTHPKVIFRAGEPHENHGDDHEQFEAFLGPSVHIELNDSEESETPERVPLTEQR